MTQQERYTIPQLAERLTQACAVEERLANIEREIQKLRQAIEQLPRPPAEKAAVSMVLYSTKGAAQALSVCRATVLRYIEMGYLPAQRNGRTLRIHKKDIDAIAKAGLPNVWSKDNKPWAHERKSKGARE